MGVCVCVLVHLSSLNGIGIHVLLTPTSFFILNAEDIRIDQMRSCEERETMTHQLSQFNRIHDLNNFQGVFNSS